MDVEFVSTKTTSKTVWDDAVNFDALIAALEDLRHHGLNPDDYHLSVLRSGSLVGEARDKMATDAWMSAAAHMLYGKLNPTSVEPDWTAARREANLSEASLRV